MPRKKSKRKGSNRGAQNNAPPPLLRLNTTELDIYPDRLSFTPQNQIELQFSDPAIANHFCRRYAFTRNSKQDKTVIVSTQDASAHWLGEKILHQLQQVNHLLNNPNKSLLGYSIYAEIKSKAADIALRMYNNDMHPLNYLLEHQKFSIINKFIYELSDNSLDHIIVQKFNGKPLFFSLVSPPKGQQPKEHPPNLWAYTYTVRLFIAGLSQQTRDQLALMRNEQGRLLFGEFALTANYEIFRVFIKYLSQETRDQLACSMDGVNSKTSYLEELIFTGQEIATLLAPKISTHQLLALNNQAKIKLITNVLTKYPINNHLLECVHKILENFNLPLVYQLLSHDYFSRQGQASVWQLFGLKSISFIDGGESKDKWSYLANKLITYAPSPHLRTEYPLFKRINNKGLVPLQLMLPNTEQSEFLKDVAFILLCVLITYSYFRFTKDIKSSVILSLSLLIIYPFISNKLITPAILEQQHWHYFGVLGRSILLKNNVGDVHVLKILKLGEDKSSLVNEYQATQYLQTHQDALGLKSKLPQPIGMVHVVDLLAWLSKQEHLKPEQYDAFTKMIDVNDTRHTAYRYQVRADHHHYFTYLHDITLSEEQYQKANQVAVHDLFRLLQKGMVYHQLADLFHNHQKKDSRTDKGRYIVLANLIRRMNSGSGRLSGWQEGVAYPNVRGTGLADWGDCISINELLSDSPFVMNYFSDARIELGNKTGNYLIANFMAEYQYVLFLIAGYRALKKTNLAQDSGDSSLEKTPTIWQQGAEQVISNCALAVSLLTGQSIEYISLRMNKVVDVTLLARQMQFWMTDEYIPYIKTNEMPDHIYAKNTAVELNFSQIRSGTFNEMIGFSINGTTPDLGPVNGQEPIKEANKLIYTMVSMIFHYYIILNSALGDLRQLIKEKDPIESELLRKNSFFYLPKKAYHRLQLDLCKQRLGATQQLTPDHRKELIQEALNHRNEAAAATLQGFFQNKAKRNEMNQQVHPNVLN